MAHEKYRSCIDACVRCAEACWLSAAFMSRGSRFSAALCRVCAEACGAECAKHKHDHRQRWAEACRACAAECRKMAA